MQRPVDVVAEIVGPRFKIVLVSSFSRFVPIRLSQLYYIDVIKSVWSAVQCLEIL